MIRLPFLFAALFAVPAAAHPSLPSADWCIGGQMQIVAGFGYDGATLDTAVHAYCADPSRNCGEFDTYTRVTTLATDRCAAYEGVYGHGDVIAFVMGPPGYTSQNHHDVYGTADGLWGYCLRCVAATQALPVRPRDAVPAR